MRYVKYGVLLLLSICVTVLIYQNYQYHKNAKLHRQFYINHLYFEAMTLRKNFDYVIKENKVTLDDYRRLNNGMTSLTVVIKDANGLMDSKLNYDISLVGLGDLLSGGISGPVHELPELKINTQLTTEQREAFTQLRDVLKNLEKGLYSPKTGQENPNLSVEKINKLLIPFFKFRTDIYF